MHGTIFVLSAIAAAVSALPSTAAGGQKYYALRFDGKSAELAQDGPSGHFVILAAEGNSQALLPVRWTGASPNQDFFFSPNKGVSTGTTTVDPSAAAYADSVSVVDGGASDGRWIINERNATTTTIGHQLGTASDGFFACQYPISVDVFRTVLSYGKVGPNGELPKGCHKTDLSLEAVYPTGAPAPSPPPTGIPAPAPHYN